MHNRAPEYGLEFLLAFDGRIYESPPSWETMLTNNVDPATLTIGRMFAKNASGSGSPTLKKVYPSRDGNASARLLDLTTFYNARLTETWHGTANATGNDLAALPAGVQNIGGVEYDLRGVIQLGGKAPTPNQFPSSVLGIKVNQKCQKLHFLHSAAWGHVQDEGKQIGTYVLHFASNNMRLDVPIVYGKECIGVRSCNLVVSIRCRGNVSRSRASCILTRSGPSVRQSSRSSWAIY